MPTDAERAAWFLLLGAKFKGFKFRRRHALGPYFVDFYCPQRRLMVELDGSVHAQPAQARRDLCRDAHLKEMGFTILRFSNGIVLNAPEIFVQIVWDAVWSLPEAFG
jgi:very-short-patch-repair endonuclease